MYTILADVGNGIKTNESNKTMAVCGTWMKIFAIGQWSRGIFPLRQPLLRAALRRHEPSDGIPCRRTLT